MKRVMRIPVVLVGLLAVGMLSASSVSAADEFDNYVVESVSASLSTTQAGAHADFTAGFELSEKDGNPYGNTKDIFVQLPPGVIGNPQRFPRCTLEEFGEKPEESECPQDAQVGVSEVELGGEVNATLIEPVYNMEAPGGDIVARFGLYAGPYPAMINVRVNPVDYSLVAAVEGASAGAALLGATTTFWGVPAADVHNGLRLTPAEALQFKLPPGGRESGQPEIPFLSNPTDCGTKRRISVTAVSYQLPNKPSTLSAPFPDIGGCGKLSFTPAFSATPTNPEAFAPTGLDAILEIPQDETPKGLATSALKSAKVSLPRGMSINPAAGAGLESCSAAQVGLGTTRPSNCPDAAKLGSVEIDVPALERTLRGSVYQRTPAPGRLFGLWVVTDELGVHLKLPAEIEADPLTGQLTTVFSGIDSLGGLPQVPFEELRMHIFGGPSAPLATPGCGAYATHYELSPWSGRPATTGDAPMQITSGCGKGGFSPLLEAGTVGLQGGSFSPFALTLTRSDGEANPTSLAVHLPEGLLADLGSVPLCPEAAAATAACPAASQVGRLAAAAGVGGAPLWIPQPGKAPTAVYLAGPYKGAPYSILAKVPAQAGPFDLGTVVNRSAIHVNPASARATIQSDPLPQILEGVPISYRTIHVAVDRPNFTLNPTDCRAKQIGATVSADNGAVATPATGFQATNCARLGFKPRLFLRLKGATRRGGNPALRAVYRPRRGDANLERLVLRLPRSAFLDQAHIRTICTRVQYAAGAGHGAQCPPGSVYGHARAFSPLLDRPLEGPVFLRASDNTLPDLVLSLRGALEIESSARIDSKNQGLRVTFPAIPDAPLSKVVVNMQGGKKGLLVNSTNLCLNPRGNRANATFGAHNERRAQGRPVVRAAGCGKGKRRGKN